MLEPNSLNPQNLRRLQLGLRRAGVLVETVIRAARLSAFDPRQTKRCSDELVNLLRYVRRYRAFIEQTLPAALMSEELYQHWADLAALRQSTLHWLGERLGQEQQSDERLCGSFEPQAWRSLGSGVVWLQALTTRNALSK
jgi:hypothetical protein